jgi:hypothetical protein
MDLEKIYAKLERIDSRLDDHMIRTEGRLSIIETEQKQTKSFIRISVGILSSLLVSVISYIFKDMFKTS